MTTTREVIPMAGTNDRLVRVAADGLWLTVKMTADGQRSVWMHSAHFTSQREALDWFAAIDPWISDPTMGGNDAATTDCRAVDRVSTPRPALRAPRLQSVDSLARFAALAAWTTGEYFATRTTRD
jgi:hypothetical protein